MRLGIMGGTGSAGLVPGGMTIHTQMAASLAEGMGDVRRLLAAVLAAASERD
jgi:hypothetical protein